MFQFIFHSTIHSASISFRTFLRAVIVPVTLVTAGCASISAPQQVSSISGSEQLLAQPDGTRAYRKADSIRYNSVALNQASINFSTDVTLDDAQRGEVQDAILKALTEHFTASGYKVINTRGESASNLALRVTVTQVEMANPGLNLLTTGLLLVPLSRGGMTVEIEALNAQNERVAAMAFSGRAGVQDIGSAFSGLGHAKTQARVVAERFVTLLTDSPGKSANQAAN
jgi:Protein of unknown function (DUF3313)